MSVWDDIGTAPRDGRPIVVANKTNACVARWLDLGQRNGWYTGPFDSTSSINSNTSVAFQPTHWAELPV